MFRELLADFDGGCFALGIKPVGNPVDGAKDGKRGQLGISVAEDTCRNSGGNDAANAPIKAVSFRNNLLPPGSRERLYVHGQSSSAQFVNHHMNEGNNDAPQFFLW